MERHSKARLSMALAVLAMVAAGGCRMDVEVGVDVAGDGSGLVHVAVELDHEASRRITDLADQLRVEDLKAAGWAVEGPQRRSDGSTTIRASKPFTTPEGAEEVFTEVSGADGPFRGFGLEQRRSFLATGYTFGGEVDLTAGLEGFGDEELRRRLQGSGVGLGTAELEQLAGTDVGEAFGFAVRAELPGTVTGHEGAAGGGDALVWRAPLGERTPLSATARVLHAERLLWLLGSAAAAVLLLVVVTRRVVRRRL